MPLFETHIIVDWSARSKPSPARPSPDSIWWAAIREGCALEPQYERTRHDAVENLAAFIGGELNAGRRVLAGFDFPFGYPEGVAARLTGRASAPALRDWLTARIADRPDNGNNRFAVAEEMNRCWPGLGPFWGRPSVWHYPEIPVRARDRTCRDGHPSERRIADLRASGAKTVWQLAYAGSVGSQVLVGLPALKRLLEDPRIGGRGAVWPFDTGLQAPDTRETPFVIAEIYPSLLRKEIARRRRDGEVPDRAQVRVNAAAFARLDRRGGLAPLFEGACGLSPDECRAVVEEEAWILGLGHEAELCRSAKTKRTKMPDEKLTCRIGVDVGGTFTDVVIDHAGVQTSAKVPTTPDAPETGVIEGIGAALERAGIAPEAVDLVIHGTTLATNALIERKGARTALLTTEGFRDSIEMAYEHRFEQYDLYMERPEPLVPRERRLGVPERLAADGSLLLPLDEAAVAAHAAFFRGEGVEAVAVGFLHSYVDDSHERRAAAILRRELPEATVCLSSEVSPEIREYDRLSTTVANAYVRPLIAGYVGRLEAALRERGLACPLLLTMSSGAVTTVETAQRFPIRLVESGPAGGAVLARNVAAGHGLDKALSFDMGGTTAKICLIDDYRPQLSRNFEVARQYRFLKGSGLPLRIPAIEMVEIGAGGGSIARVDALRRIVVGPDSAGADPGPACYGRGGGAPTVTDADLMLGRIDPARFAGGTMALDGDAARQAVERDVGGPLGMTDEVAAAGVSEIVDEAMANAARVHAIESGKPLGGRVLIAFGGAAPLHAARLATKLGIDTVIVPPGAGVGSAIGFLSAPIAYEVVRSRFVALDNFAPAIVDALFDEMRAEAEAVVRLGAPDAVLEETRTGYMRYRGQGHEIAVELPERADADDYRERFDEAYRRLYGRTIPALEVEVMSWSLALGAADRLPPRLPLAPPRAAGAPAGKRTLYDTEAGGPMEAAVHLRADLAPGVRLAGPAVVVEDETATVAPEGFDLTVAASGALVLTRRGAA